MSAKCKPDRHEQLQLNTIATGMTFQFSPWGMYVQSLLLTNLRHTSFSYICLFQFSTCFEERRSHHQESPLYLYYLWYMSFYVGDIYQRSYWYNWLSWWWALGRSKHVENWNKQIQEKELCIKLVINKDCNKMHGQQKKKDVRKYVRTYGVTEDLMFLLVTLIYIFKLIA